jgi:hypothetical protein
LPARTCGSTVGPRAARTAPGCRGHPASPAPAPCTGRGSSGSPPSIAAAPSRGGRERRRRRTRS